MTAKKTTATAKATQKTAAEIKADEVAALMGDDEGLQVSTAPKAPPAVKEADKSEPEAEEKAADETEEQAEVVDQASAEESDDSGNQDDDQEDDLDTDEDESDDQDDEQEGQSVKAAVGHMVIVTKTIHTKDADGKDVKFIASKEPQDLGEYGELAIKAKCAKPHKAG